MYRPIFVVILLCGILNRSQASIKCFVCSYPDKNCGDLFGYTTPDAYECAPGVLACFKRRGLKDNAEVYRGCSSDYDGSGTCRNVRYNNIDLTECLCTTDYCNESSFIHSKSPFSLMLIHFMLFCILKYLF